MRINPEKKEDRERVAQTLLRVTLRLAYEHGFVSLGLREVSRAADIAPTSFYRHFADMEELGRELIESLAGPFMESWVTRARAKDKAAETFSLALGREAIAGAVEDPELVRFVLAERTGAIPSFRAAVRKKLAVLSAAVAESLSRDLPGADAASRALVADAVVALILGALSDVLDEGAAHAPLVVTRLAAQLGAVLAGAPEGGRT